MIGSALLPRVPPVGVERKLSNLLEDVRRDKMMAPCTSVHSIVWSQATKISD